jgi:hypothetical protein
MKVTPLSDDIEFCEDGKYRAWRSKSPHLRGLSVQLQSGEQDGIIYSVETGGPLSKQFIDPLGHSPLQVQARVLDEGTAVVITSCAVQYIFGDRTDPVEKAVIEAVGARIEELIEQQVSVCVDSLDAEVRGLRGRVGLRKARDVREIFEQSVREVRGNLESLRDAEGVALLDPEYINLVVDSLNQDFAIRVATDGSEAPVAPARDNASRAAKQGQDALSSGDALSEREVKEVAVARAAAQVFATEAIGSPFSTEQVMRIAVDIAYGVFRTAIYAGGIRDRQAGSEGSVVPPTHAHSGSNSERQSVGDPGHCELCAQVGHVVAHPELGCGDVGCDDDHDGDGVVGD